MKNLLLLSSENYKNLNSFDWCESLLNDFFSKSKQIALIPYAQVIDDYNSLEKSINSKLNTKVVSIHKDPIKVLNDSDSIMVAGGNLFVLLYKLQEYNLLEIIKEKIENGAFYAGWGAGASLLSENLKTCNDLPILFPKDLNALGVLKYQIIPEYSCNNRDFIFKLHGYFKLNPASFVFALPYGSALKIHNDSALVMGNEGVLKLSQHYEQYFKLGDFIKL